MYLQWDLRRTRVDRQRVYVAAHEFSGGSIDHPVPFHRRVTGEGRRRDHYVKVPTLARTGVAFMFGAVVANVEQRRMQRSFEGGAQAFDPRAHQDSFGWYPRSSQNMRPAVNTNTSGKVIQVLKNTQVGMLLL